VPDTPDSPDVVAALQEANARLQAENAELKAQIAEQAEKIARLERLVSRNSGNSSMPPSTDDLPGKTPPERRTRQGGMKQKPGKQPGAPGAFLAWNEYPDKTEDVFPEGICSCGADLNDARDLGVKYSHQVTDLPEARAVTVQHDRHEVECACGRRHVPEAPPQAGVPGTVTYGLNFQAWCVFLMVMHHVPVERCADILESMSGTRPSDGWVHGLLERAARAVAAANKTIRALIILARVICGDETPLRAGPGPKQRKKYLHVACTNLLTYYFLGERDLPSFRAFVYSDLHGTVIVHDRYQNYDSFAGISHQLCCQHLLRDLEDAAQAYPDAIWPGQIAGALRGLIHAANLARDQDLAAVPADRAAEGRPEAVPPRRRRRPVAGPPRARRQGQAAASADAAGMPAPPRSRRAAVPHRYRHPADQQPGRTRPAAGEDPAEDLRPAPLGENNPRPVRRPRLRINRRQARDRRLHRHPGRPRREPLDATRPGQHIP
jgi:transposase